MPPLLNRSKTPYELVQKKLILTPKRTSLQYYKSITWQSLKIPTGAKQTLNNGECFMFDLFFELAYQMGNIF